MAFELLTFKIMEVIKVCDHANIEMDESEGSTHKHLRWMSKFFEVFRVIYKMEKHRYQEPKFFEIFKPLAKFLRERQKQIIKRGVILSNETLFKQSEKKLSTVSTQEKIET